MPAFLFEVEYAKSARSACKQCKDKIEKDAVRVGLKAATSEDPDADEMSRQKAHLAESTKWHHHGCFSQIRGAAWFRKHLPERADECSGFSDLSEADQEKVRTLFATCRGGASDASDTPSKSAPPAKKRKAGSDADADGQKGPKRASDETRGVLSEEQLCELEGVKTELSKKSTAMLGALLSKNGLPKTGRKEELVERAAECRVLGVPPSCSVCEKGRLKWSRITGLFSCPGFFDEEDKRFKRCKGPGEDANIVRTLWQELVV